MARVRTPTLRVPEIAELLGVTKQRAHQIAAEPASPRRSHGSVGARLWERRKVAAWAQEWRKEKPWRA